MTLGAVAGGLACSDDTTGEKRWAVSTESRHVKFRCPESWQRSGRIANLRPTRPSRQNPSDRANDGRADSGIDGRYRDKGWWWWAGSARFASGAVTVSVLLADAYDTRTSCTM
ncbi:uncharacterized protein CLUP02_09207 [Colletotrichum lupini]|uniref:Uncharacterized protein n=1 Tax=Colletotrichum lupini TaxID=145971 RepID=A0A9Q8SVT0_9PEZI|nr:uncharacterized protein CLUP02_09207 [Colletotrichum lupini]KAK1712656.1 hypothetical protein BDP67DRAFT_51750 [Colletotrichum lupini]UQC83711.1 hypothetical protein CLUP02_09207 [Colletotrichum lupini]